jgi:ADP-ribose pyrophosphatase
MIIAPLPPEEASPTPINKVSKLTDYRWLNLYDVEYVTAEGKVGHWTFASRKTPQPAGSPLVADAVVIIPLLKDGRKRKLVTIKEFRIPLGDYEYGTPAGLYNHSETAEKVAKRELKEETGLKLTKVLYVGPACVSSAGLSDESVVYIVCECTGEVNTQGNEGTEDITVEVLDLEGIRALRNSNNKISAKTLPFLLMFDAMNKIAWPRHMRQEQPKKRANKKPDDTDPGSAAVSKPTPDTPKPTGRIVEASAVVYPAKGLTFASPAGE